MTIRAFIRDTLKKHIPQRRRHYDMLIPIPVVYPMQNQRYPIPFVDINTKKPRPHGQGLRYMFIIMLPRIQQPSLG